jgi:5'-nucleotidase
MPLDLSPTLVVGISSTSLFDLREAEKVWKEEGIDAYRQYMRNLEDTPLEPGTAMPLVKALLSLNKHKKDGEPALVEVVVMSRVSPGIAMRVLKTVRQMGLSISRYAFTGGEPLVDYMRAFSIDLFLSHSESDVQGVIDSGTAAAALLYPPPANYQPPEDQVRIAFDADAVLFSDESEVLYKAEGLEAFHGSEDASREAPMKEGPYAGFLKKLASIQTRLPGRVEYSAIRLAIVTARNAPAEWRVITTLRHWGVYIDAAFFLGGLDKTAVLQALRPHIFFDDQELHVAPASELVPSGRVPYRTTSPLHSGKAIKISTAPSTTVPLSWSPADLAAMKAEAQELAAARMAAEQAAQAEGGKKEM